MTLLFPPSYYGDRYTPAEEAHMDELALLEELDEQSDYLSDLEGAAQIMRSRPAPQSIPTWTPDQGDYS